MSNTLFILAMNGGTLLVLAILLIVVGLVIAGMIKDKKAGKSLSCGCDCSSCASACGCTKHLTDEQILEKARKAEKHNKK